MTKQQRTRFAFTLDKYSPSVIIRDSVLVPDQRNVREVRSKSQYVIYKHNMERNPKTGLPYGILRIAYENLKARGKQNLS